MINNLPRLELTEDPNKNNEYIIYRYPVKKTINTKMVSRKDGTKKTRSRNSRKGFFNIFT